MLMDFEKFEPETPIEKIDFNGFSWILMDFEPKTPIEKMVIFMVIFMVMLMDFEKFEPETPIEKIVFMDFHGNFMDFNGFREI